MSHADQILRNTLFGWLSKALQYGLALLVVPLYLAALGKEGYGVIGLLTIFAAISSVADLGLRSALARVLAERVALDDVVGFRSVSATAGLAYVAMATVLAAVFWVASPALVTGLNVEPSMRGEVVYLFRVFSCSTTFISFLAPVLHAGLASRMRFDLANIVQSVTAIVLNAVLVLVVYLAPARALHLYVLATIAAQVLSLAMLFVFYRSICFGGVLDLTLARWRHLRSLVPLGLRMYAIQLSEALSDKADPLIISSYLGPGGVALYQPAAKVILAANPIVMALAGQLFPLTTRYSAQGDLARLRRVLSDGTRLTLLLGSLVVAGALAFAHPFCRLWLRSSLGGDHTIVAWMMQLYAVVELLTYATGTQWSVFLGMNRLSDITRVVVTTAVLNVALSVYLVGHTSLGIFGVLVGTLASRIVRLVVLTGIAAEMVDLPLARHVRTACAPPLACMAVTAIAAFGLVSFFRCDTWFRLLLMIAITFTVWAAAAVSIGLSPGDRAMVRSLLMKPR